MAAACAVLALAACVSDDAVEESFHAEVIAADRDVERALRSIRAARTPDQARTRRKRAVHTLRERIRELAEEDVPAELERHRRGVVAALRALATDLRSFDAGDVSPRPNQIAVVDPAIVLRVRRALSAARRAARPDVEPAERRGALSP